MVGFVGALALGLAGHGPTAKAVGAADPPNVVVVTLDDEAMSQVRRESMPKTYQRVIRPGTTFKNSLAAPPLCCPDRASFLTGEYPHNNGVNRNHPGYSELIHPKNVLPAWLHEAGYRTALVGKYLNGTSSVLGSRPAPGWDHWYGIYGKASYYGADVSNDGRRIHLHDRYLDSVLARKAQAFVRRAAKHRPFFLWFTPFAPHFDGGKDPRGNCSGVMPKALARDYRRVRDIRLPRDRSFNERDVSDKPRQIRELPRLNNADIRLLTRRYRCGLGAIREVDRAIGEIVGKLRAADELRNTAIFVTSDNGFFFGEHRLKKGKGQTYEPALRVPLMARLPRDQGIQAPKVSEPVAELDLAPTILDLAGADPCLSPTNCRTMDGRSLRKLTTGSNAGWPNDRGILVEQGRRCGYSAIRTHRYVLTLDRTHPPGGGACRQQKPELYNLRRDPFELRNTGTKRSAKGTVDALSQRIDALSQCSGIPGRDPGGSCE